MTPVPTSMSPFNISNGTSESRNSARLAILEIANLISVPMTLNAILRLKVPDAIWAHGANTPLTATEILSRILPNSPTADPENLQRMLRLLTTYNIFVEHLSDTTTTPVQRRYSLTDVGKTLVPDSEGLSYGEYIMQHHQDALVRSWPLVHMVVVDPVTEPFVRVNGESAYWYYGKDEEMNELLQKAMAGFSVPFMRELLEGGYDGFGRGVERLVDVGGCAGNCLKMIMQKFGNIKEGINFDLPDVVANAPSIPGVTHVGGDMLKSIPSGDAIFMKWVLTAWTDEEVEHILTNCYKALPVGGKLIVCEPVLPEQTDNSLGTRALLQGDIFVMTIYRTKGKHRTEKEYKQLGMLAGFSHCQAVNVDYFHTILEYKK